jgi:signal transduction histidine kinase
MTKTLEQQLKNTVEIEINRLKTEYDTGGISELKDEVSEVDGGINSLSLFEYGVVDGTGALIAGSFPDFQPRIGWQTIQHPIASDAPGKKAQRLVYVKVIALDNNWLAVGHNGNAIQNAGAAIIRAFIWGFVLVVVLGAAGGLYLSRAFLKKIAAITTSTQAIIAGDLKHRLPVSQNRDELDNLAVLLNRMLDKIGGLIDNIQQVSNDIAHDLRTPISHLKFRLEDALTQDLTAEQYPERISFAIEEVDNILATFAAMLRISQIESGSRRSGFKTVNLSAIAVSVLEALQPVADEQGKTIHADIVQNVTLTGDKELLTQLVFNLLDNAIVHTPCNTQIGLSLCLSDGHIELSVSDNGPGIAKAYHQKIFQRFYRLEQSRTTPGNGLGLSIVAAIAALHEGTLALFDNKPGLKVVLTLLRH